MQVSVRVSLLGQNAIVREGLRRILSDEGFDVRQSVDDPSRLADDQAHDDLLILIDGDGQNVGTEMIYALHSRFASVRLVVLSDRFELEDMIEAFRAGVCGYMVKEISSEPLIASLRLVAMGEKVMPSRLVEALSSHTPSDEQEDGRLVLERAHLSCRENEILGWLIVGCSNKTISRRLAISEATVKVHVKAILRKLRVRNRTQAAIRGINAGMSFDPNMILSDVRNTGEHLRCAPPLA